MNNLDEEIKRLQITKLNLEIEELKTPEPEPQFWNSLEWVKLISSLILPVVLLVITYNASSRLQKIDDNQKALTDQNKIAMENNKRIYDMRFNIYQQIGSRLNEVYCYLSYVGKWKELSPSRIIENKIVCDETMYSNQSLFNPDFFAAYKSFMYAAYIKNPGEGQDVKIQSMAGTHKKYYEGNIPWQNRWDNLFMLDPATNELTIRKEVNNTYNQLLTLLPKELNIKEVQVNNEFNDTKPE